MLLAVSLMGVVLGTGFSVAGTYRPLQAPILEQCGGILFASGLMLLGATLRAHC